MLNLLLCQGRSRLVQNENFRVIRYRFCNFNHLPLGNAQLADDGLRVYGNIKVIENLFCFLEHYFMADKTALLRETSQPDIFHNAALENLVQLLMYHRNAVFHSVFRTCKMYRLSVNANFAAVLFINAK